MRFYNKGGKNVKNKITELSHKLKLSYIKSNYSEELEKAEQTKPTYKEFLTSILTNEVERRYSNSIIQRVRSAGFPNKKYLSDLVIADLPKPAQERIHELSNLDFIAAGRNLILIGNPGVGKTHIAIGLGIKACESGYKTLYLSTPNLITQLKEAVSNNQLILFKKKFMTYDLVILDELGYISFDKQGGELLFNLLSNRNEKKSTIVTSNLEFGKWTEIFNDVILTTAIIDRLIYKSIIINMTGESYRIKETKKNQEVSR